MAHVANPVTWFEIYVTDLERARAFYESVFGYVMTPVQTDGSFKAYHFPGQVPHFGAMGALMHHPMREPSSEGSIVYFHCEDAGLLSNLALKHGGLIHRAKWGIGADGFIALIGDSEGNTIGLHSFQ